MTDPPDRTSDSRGVDVQDAARILGLSTDAVRAKLRRGTLEGYRDNRGNWRVILPDRMRPDTDSQPTVEPQDADRTRQDVEDALRDHLADIQNQLERTQQELAAERQQARQDRERSQAALETARLDIAAANRRADEAHQQTTAAATRADDAVRVADRLVSELEKERARSWWQRLVGR
jgi:chromosome segregation ATPase